MNRNSSTADIAYEELKKMECDTNRKEDATTNTPPKIPQEESIQYNEEDIEPSEYKDQPVTDIFMPKEVKMEGKNIEIRKDPSKIEFEDAVEYSKKVQKKVSA